MAAVSQGSILGNWTDRLHVIRVIPITAVSKPLGTSLNLLSLCH